MAGFMVGGAFLGSFLNVLFDKLASPEVVNFIRGEKLSPLFKKLKITLTVVNVVLNDAEKKQFSDSGVKDWLDELKDVVYMADDLLDEVATKAAVAAAATQKEVTTSNFFSGLFNTAPDGDMATRLKEIVDSLEYFLKFIDSLGLKETAMENVPSRILSRSVQGGKLYGREEDKKAIIKLFSENNESEQVSWIPIVGMGGVGKTTLAQMVYNDEDVKQKFDFNFKAWVCVSESFDIMKVVKSLTEALTQKACEFEDPNILQEKLVEMLKKKKFLIVLDDVWIQDYSTWNNLKQLFQCGMRGSKILLTTRSKNVASPVQTVKPYRLSQLSYEDSWLVFAHHACLSLGSGENTTSLEQIGREIVKKCDGLPLAAQSLGGSLRATRKIIDWNNVLNSDIWTLPKSEIIPSLRVSYDYLHPDLKRCFLYCSLYQKDVEFEKNDMIQLWMAEDLLPLQKNGKTLEEVGDKYFDDLLSSSFLQRSSTPKKKGYYFGMHDLMHDLATSLGGKFYFRSNDLEKESTIDSQTRHLSFNKYFSSRSSKSSRVLGSSKFLRTVLRVTDKNEYNTVKFPETPVELPNLECLRVLSFYKFKILAALSDSIGGHIHLRYLNLSCTRLKSLPESICNLYNLQTLKLEGCENLTMLPSGMQNLVNLHYLGISNTGIKEEMPKGMSKLNKLQHLPYFIVGKHEGIKINELGGFPNLHGSFAIQKLENVENGSEALKARMMDKKHIQHLVLDWSSVDEEGCMDFQTELDILSELKPHQDLESLEIKGYRGTRYPDWVGKPCYHNMTNITLSGCNNCFTLPSLGRLPSLTHLMITKCKMLKTADGSFFNKNDNNNDGNGSLLTVVPFPSLESLHFKRMPCWEVWSCSEQPGAFPKLKLLKIEECRKLKGDLPSDLPALEELYIDDCDELTISLPIAPSLRQIKIYRVNVIKGRPSDLPALEILEIKSHRQLPISHFSRAPALRKIKIFRCGSYKAGIIIDKKFTCLESLHLKECSSAVSFPGDCLPASLKTLKIMKCGNLEFPQQQQTHELLLESLDIEDSCQSLTSLSLETFPNLKELSISECKNLESLFVSQSRDVALQKLLICCCPRLESLARKECSSDEAMKDTLFPNLKSIFICDCPRLESFPEQGMPGLREIEFSSCGEKLVMSGLASPSMDKLTYLVIEGPCDWMKSFPMEGLLLPPSIETLHLKGLSSLETLDCKGLLHLTQLQTLRISWCPKLENMAGESLPASLIQLSIRGCPLLGEQCRTKHPHIWPKISHIQIIEVATTF